MIIFAATECVISLLLNMVVALHRKKMVVALMLFIQIRCAKESDNPIYISLEIPNDAIVNYMHKEMKVAKFHFYSAMICFNIMYAVIEKDIVGCPIRLLLKRNTQRGSPTH